MASFLFSFYNPGGCGISDVIARLLEADASSFLICHRSSAAASAQIKIAADQIGPLETDLRTSGGVIFPWVDHSVGSWETAWLDQLSRLSIPRILWIHEMWYQSLSGYRLSGREHLKTIFQKLHFRQIVRRFSPTALATTNGWYQHSLTEAGYLCGLLPNTPTIPVGSAETGRVFVSSKIEDRSNAWVVASLGNLALRYWDWPAALQGFFAAAQKRNKRAVWVILGRSLDKDVSSIREYLVRKPVPIELHYPGELSSMEIDQWLQGADAGMSGHSYALWEKSTGLQAMTARNISAVTPRKGFTEDRYARANPLLYATFAEIPLCQSTQMPPNLTTSPSQWMVVCQSLLNSLAKSIIL